MCGDYIPFFRDGDDGDLTFELFRKQIPFMAKFLWHWNDGFKNLSVDEGFELMFEYNERLPVIKRFADLFEKLKIVKKDIPAQ